MNTKSLVILTAVAAALGGTVFIIGKQKDSRGTDAAGSVVVKFDPSQVTRVSIAAASGAVNLALKDNRWVVEDRANYPAQFDRIKDVITKVWRLKTVQEVKVGASQFGRLELAEPLTGAAMRVEFKDKDGKSLGAIIAGKKHVGETEDESPMAAFGGGGMASGRYVVPVGGKTVSLVSETLDDIEAKPESWLARDFFKIYGVSAITLAGTTDAQKWKVTRENTTAEWKLDGAKPEEKADAAKVSTAATAFQNPTFTDVLAPDAKLEAHGLDKPAVATIETFDGFTYVLKVGKLENGNAPVMVEVSGKFATERAPGKDEKEEDRKRLDEEFKTKIKGFEEKLAAEKKFEGRAFLVAQFTIEQVVKDRSALLAEKAPETPTAATPPAPAVPGVPPTVATPPVAAPPAPDAPKRKPIEAVTPPVSVPPVPDPEKPEGAKKAPAAVPAKPNAPEPPAPASKP